MRKWRSFVAGRSAETGEWRVDSNIEQGSPMMVEEAEYGSLGIGNKSGHDRVFRSIPGFVDIGSRNQSHELLLPARDQPSWRRKG